MRRTDHLRVWHCTFDLIYPHCISFMIQAQTGHYVQTVSPQGVSVGVGEGYCLENTPGGGQLGHDSAKNKNGLKLILSYFLFYFI